MKWARLAVAALSAGLLLYFVWEAGHLYTDSAPFNQRYQDASDDQNRIVLRRMIFALVGAPITLLGLIAAIAGGRLGETPRRWARILGFILLLASLQSCGVYASLPYGFGSGYEHASALQQAHIALANRAGIATLVAGAITLAAAQGFPVHRRRLQATPATSPAELRSARTPLPGMG